MIEPYEGNVLAWMYDIERERKERLREDDLCELPDEID